MFSRKQLHTTKTNRKTQFKSALILILLLLFCAIPLLSVTFSEDISAMLPSGKDGEISRDFALLQKAPLSGKILISIASNEIKENELGKIADSMARKMDSPLLAIQDISDINPQSVIDFLLRNGPNLTTQNDLEKLQTHTDNKTIKTNLSDAKKLLISPAGFGMRAIVAEDPLNLRSIYLQKIAPLQNLPRLKIQGGNYYVSGENAVLLIAKSNIPMTDSKNGAILLDRFQKIKQAALAENHIPEMDLSIEILSGHCYTTANAAIIKQDILTVSIISFCALAILFFFGFRNKGALCVFLAPGIAIMAGLGTTAFVYREMSAIVIGFGAVLMGISIDFAVHTYFALAESPQDKAGAVRRVSKPVLFGAATSCVSFTALYISGIPGIKQLSIFSVAGIIAACAYALLFIPRLCNSFPVADKNKFFFQLKSNKKITLCVASSILAVSIAGAFSNNFDTELKNLGYISSEISNAEKHFQEKWGKMRAQSMLFASGKTMDEALHKNENAWADIKQNLAEAKAVSIAPALPAAATIAKNQARWSNFWNNEKEQTELSIQKFSEKIGFAPNAFVPAMDRISAAPPILNAQTFQNGPLGVLAEMFIPPTNEGEEKLLMTLLPDNTQVNTYYSPQKEKELGVRLVSQSRFKSTLEHEMERDIIKFITCSGLLVTVLIFGLFRNLRRAALALFPAVFGVAVTFGLLGLLEIPLNIFHIVALPLVIGLGADYGIFMVFQEIRMPSLWTVKAVKISGLTTLAGFGVLVFAKHPSLHSLGATVSIGITAALCCAIFVLPHLLHLEGDNHA
ncbi:MMPL family transporter [Desulfovibrio sp. JC022]|uniref:MMPL family transporter n=1 Tax=Desulfovibrio sp. JC022 TaxID=2593642 RepID=UPI0013D3FAAF|nr:MMPL family transporter [Desulfovibrio sp. JC022]NDV23251.1 MMPL family transporter [Desulfovibrio sp. JC022]